MSFIWKYSSLYHKKREWTSELTGGHHTNCAVNLALPPCVCPRVKAPGHGGLLSAQTHIFLFLPITFPPPTVTADSALCSHRYWTRWVLQSPFASQVLPPPPHKTQSRFGDHVACSLVTRPTGSHTRCSRCDPFLHLAKIQHWPLMVMQARIIKVTTTRSWTTSWKDIYTQCPVWYTVNRYIQISLQLPDLTSPVSGGKTRHTLCDSTVLTP